MYLIHFLILEQELYLVCVAGYVYVCTGMYVWPMSSCEYGNRDILHEPFTFLISAGSPIGT